MRVRFDPRTVICAISGLACLVAAFSAQAQMAPSVSVPPVPAAPVPAAQPAPVTSVDLAYLALAVKRTLPLSYLDQPPSDEGIQGARLALADDETTGRFIHQTYHLTEAIQPDEAAVLDAFKRLAAAGRKIFVTDLPAALLLRIADLPEAKDATFLDATSEDDMLRAEGCRANILHLLPSRAMLADALMQYLAVKKWRNILLVSGPEVPDKAYAEAIRHAAAKFQIHIVQDKPWTYDPGARRTDTGHYAIEAEVARFTQGISYDVLVVADEGGNFGDELSYRGTDPRPIAGTQGLVPSAWARPFEQWGGTQLQSRFLKQAGRWMTDRDYGAWMAVRTVGEAAARGGGTDPKILGAFMRGADFELAAFKGARLSFRPWDGQLRQPVLLADARSLVSVSPQPGFLHQVSELDTLGVDQPESSCHLE
ncbi:MAG TPA: ABC transporter substrate-binding protein [Stellaceae bacterium]|nr:ABC transporter substrate-binding protein [Stellaceae bacterium]